MVAVVHKPLNILFFFLGLSLAFVPFSYGQDCCRRNQISPDSTDVDGFYASLDGTKLQRIATVEVTEPSSCTASSPTSFHAYNSSEYRWTEDTGACSSETINIHSLRSYKLGVTYYGVCDIPYDQCAPLEPATCTDGLPSAGEVGIDCGGECADSCDSSICENENAVLVDNLCVQQTTPDSFGNCPSGTTLVFTESANVCQTSSIPPIQYYSGDVTTDPYDDFTLDPEPDIDPFESGQISFVQDPEIVIDNGDGTETATVKKYTKRMNPKTGLWETVSTGSASVSRTVNSPSGTGFVSGSSGAGIAPGFSGEVEDEIPMEATPLIAAPDGLDFGDKLTDLLNSSSAEFESYVDDVQGSDLVQHFTDVFTLPDDPGDSPLTISMGAYGVHLVDSQMMDITLSLVGQVLVVCAFIAGAYIVFRKQ